MNNKFYVTEELKKLRTQKKLSRRILGERCNISDKTIQRAENGKRIKLYCIERISKVLDIDENILIDIKKI